MKYPKIPLAQQIIQLCAAKKIEHVVISPGSRNAPLTQGFASHPDIKTYSIVDERCAAFFALGMAQQLQQPVAVVCTSGSAVLNYYPAVAEAFYSNIPLVVISADRPKHLINIGDGQTINQENVFEKHILYSANLKQDLQENEERFSSPKDIPSFILDKLLHLDKERLDANQQEINTAINIAITKSGPIHINAPFAEPLYETQIEFTEKIKVIAPKNISKNIASVPFQEFLKLWNNSKKRMVLVGVNTPNTISNTVVDFLANDKATVVLTESTSNLHHPIFFNNIDQLIAPLNTNELEKLQPDVLLTFGGMVVSKKIKQFLRTHKPKAHFHIDLQKATDTFFSLKYHFEVSTNLFFKELQRVSTAIDSEYKQVWLSVKKNRKTKHDNYLKTIPFSDFKVFETILTHLPNTINLHLSNSSTIRYVQLFTQNKNIKQYCNRGTSGIDGCTSTAIGHAVIAKNQNVLITGDLSFLYDSNGLWNNYIPKNFRIILINNTGGGIFRILPGDKNTANFETYFETNHTLNALHLCKMYDIDYQQICGNDELKIQLNTFFDNSKKPKLIEIFTPRTVNDTVLIDYFKYLGS